MNFFATMERSFQKRDILDTASHMNGDLNVLDRQYVFLGGNEPWIDRKDGDSALCRVRPKEKGCIFYGSAIAPNDGGIRLRFASILMPGSSPPVISKLLSSRDRDELSQTMDRIHRISSPNRLPEKVAVIS